MMNMMLLYTPFAERLTRTYSIFDVIDIFYVHLMHTILLMLEWLKKCDTKMGEEGKRRRMPSNN